MSRFVIAAAALIVALFLVAPSAAQQTRITSIEEANDTWALAHLAFEQGRFGDAFNLYLAIAESGFATPTVWANAGTAAFRNDDPGRAVLAYARALRLDPSYERALLSLDIVSPATNAGFGGVSADLMRSPFGRIPPLLWVVLAQLAYVAVCYGVYRSITAQARDQRIHWVTLTAWSGVAAILFAVAAIPAHTRFLSGNEAVVTAATTIARNAPRADSLAELELPAGTIVRLSDDSQRGFVRVRLLDGRGGYVPIADLERI